MITTTAPTANSGINICCFLFALCVFIFFIPSIGLYHNIPAISILQCSSLFSYFREKFIFQKRGLYWEVAVICFFARQIKPESAFLPLICHNHDNRGSMSTPVGKINFFLKTIIFTVLGKEPLRKDKISFLISVKRNSQKRKNIRATHLHLICIYILLINIRL